MLRRIDFIETIGLKTIQIKVINNLRNVLYWIEQWIVPMTITYESLCNPQDYLTVTV